ncbi:MAG TPA: cell division protein FtsZ, partial [Bacteroidia bacterium]|nr:cell division protein FtsZ [Bacteroidia bacterium]
KSISEIITVPGYINVDFEDVKTAVQNSGVAIMGSSKAEGENRAIKAVEQALASPLLNDNNIKGARYILMNIASGTREVTMDEIGEITDYIQEQAGLTADIIWGNCHEEELGDMLNVTIIATGFKTREELGHDLEIVKHNAKVVHVLGKDAPAANIPPVQKEQVADVVSMEPTLIKSSEPLHSNDNKEMIQENNEISFEFSVGNTSKESPIGTPIAEKKEEPLERKQDQVVYNLNDHTLEEDPTEEQLRKSRERILKLKSLSYRIGNSNITDMEKEPAYKRRNIKLDSVPHSSESNVSRYSLSNEDEKKAELRQNNSFLHDNVD